MFDLAATLEHMFKLVDVTLIEKLIRPVVVYFFLIIGLRLAGKRELAQLNTFDLVVLLTLSNTVQNAIIGNDNTLLGGIIGAAALLATNAVFVRFLFSHEKLDRLIEGDPDVLIENGKVKMDRLKAELMTLSELEIAAHKQGFASLQDVDRATLEPGGVITFIAHKPEPEVARQTALLARMDEISRKLDALAANRGLAT
ncbi:MAG TPA: YetF domain-containing protein [Pirellulales bacterium]|nr:YetF domain-containing protein [Pirellulales bacterium]